MIRFSGLGLIIKWSNKPGTTAPNLRASSSNHCLKPSHWQRILYSALSWCWASSSDKSSSMIWAMTYSFPWNLAFGAGWGGDCPNGKDSHIFHIWKTFCPHNPSHDMAVLRRMPSLHRTNLLQSQLLQCFLGFQIPLNHLLEMKQLFT